MGGIGGRGGIKMASASTPSVNELTRASFLVPTVKLKPIIKAQISGKLVTSGKLCSDRFSTLRENPYEEDDYDNYY